MRYFPLPPPRAQENLLTWLIEELRRIATSTFKAHSVELEKTYVAPSVVTDGLVVYADGTSWDPGLGEGIYAYYAGSWNKLG